MTIANAFLDCVKFRATLGGTVDFIVSAAITGYQTPAQAAATNAALYSYRAESDDLSQWEYGIATYTSATTTMARTTVLGNSSNTTSKIDFTLAPSVAIVELTQDINNGANLSAGTIPIGRLNGGTVNQFVQGDGTFQTQGRKLLNTLTAASSASLSDTTSLTSAFSDYEIVLTNIIPASSAVSLELVIHSGGVFQGSSYVTETQANSAGAAAFAQNTTFIQIGSNQNSVAPGISGTIRVFGPVSGASVAKQWTALLSGQSTSACVTIITSGYWNNTAAVDGFEIIFSAGSITSGTVKVYGLN